MLNGYGCFRVGADGFRWPCLNVLVGASRCQWAVIHCFARGLEGWLRDGLGAYLFRVRFAHFLRLRKQ